MSKKRMEEYNVIIEKGEDGYLIAEVVGLPGCHTQAKNMDELIKRIKDAISLYIEDSQEEFSLPKFIGIQKIEV